MHTRARRASAPWLVLGLAAGTARAQGPRADGAGEGRGAGEAGALVVTATRTPEPLQAVPASVVTFEREEILAEAALANNQLGETLGRLVPGLGLGSQSQSVHGQSMRGRQALVLIDGIPQRAVRDVARDLETIAPLLVERIEVVRGSSALYGEGAAGGFINIVTRRPPGSGRARRTELAIATAPRRALGGLGGTLGHTMSHRRGPFDYSVVGTVGRSGGLFDGSGDRIPPDPQGQGGLADLWTWGVVERAGFSPTADQRLELAGVFFRNLQTTDHTSDPAVDAEPPGSRKARALAGLDLPDRPSTRNGLVDLTYRHARLLGGTLAAQVYYRNFTTRFSPVDGRLTASLDNQVLQPRLKSQRLGARLQATLPLPARLAALYGVDASAERTSETVAILDGALLDRSGGRVFRALGVRTFAPETAADALAPFVQLGWAAAPWLGLRAGVRHELMRLRAGDHTTLAGNAVGGGDLRAGESLLHAGLVLGGPGGVSGFASAAQALALPDVGLVLAHAPPGATLAGLDLAPQRVNAYEIGLRFDGARAAGTVAVFHSTSDRGAGSAGLDPPAPRAPDRVQGVEATGQVRLGATWRAAAAVSFVEGEWTPPGAGTERALDGYRIPPWKASAQLGKRILGGWDIRLSGIYSGGRDRFAGSTRPGERALVRYLLVDLLSTAALGPGHLRLGLANLLDRQYAPVASQLLWSGTNRTHSAGSGLRVSVGYGFDY
jgi:iron complex outermembrane recepter protein